MIRLSVQNVSQAIAEAQRQSRGAHIAVTNALNMTGKQVKTSLVDEMRRVFDNPTKFTLNSVFMRPATDADQTVTIWLKDFAPKGTPASKYLSPQIFGGFQNQKRSEKILMRAGVMRSDQTWIPGEGAKVDQFGNINRAQLVQILSDIQVFGEQGYRANRNPTKTAKYFVLKRGSVNIAIMDAQTKKAVLVFTKSIPEHKERFDFFGVANATFDRHFSRNYETISARIFRRSAA
jgi:hypothetical protein